MTREEQFEKFAYVDEWGEGPLSEVEGDADRAYEYGDERIRETAYTSYIVEQSQSRAYLVLMLDDEDDEDMAWAFMESQL